MYVTIYILIDAKSFETICLVSSSGPLPAARLPLYSGGIQLHIGDARWCCTLLQHNIESHLLSRKWGVTSVARNNVAIEDAGEEVTEDEESFHKHTTRDDAYWDSVMQAIAMDASVPSEPKHSKRFENMDGGEQNGTVAAEKKEKQSGGT